MLPVRVVTHSSAVARFALHDVEGSSDAFGSGKGRGDAGFGRAPRVHGLGHRIRAERLLQAGGESGDRRERMREVLCVEAEQFGGGTRRAEAAYGASVVPVVVVRTAHSGGDPRRDL